MRNKEIRMMLMENNIKMYELAEELGITPNTLSHWFQLAILGERKEQILKAIDKLKRG